MRTCGELQGWRRPCAGDLLRSHREPIGSCFCTLTVSDATTPMATSLAIPSRAYLVQRAPASSAKGGYVAVRDASMAPIAGARRPLCERARQLGGAPGDPFGDVTVARAEIDCVAADDRLRPIGGAGRRRAGRSWFARHCERVACERRRCRVGRAPALSSRPSGCCVCPAMQKAARVRRPRSSRDGQARASLRREAAVWRWRCWSIKSRAPSLSTSIETLTIEESMTLRARTENAGHGGGREWSWSSRD
jgi:hypothetical protein